MTIDDGTEPPPRMDWDGLTDAQIDDISVTYPGGGTLNPADLARIQAIVRQEVRQALRFHRGIAEPRVPFRFESDGDSVKVWISESDNWQRFSFDRFRELFTVRDLGDTLR